MELDFDHLPARNRCGAAVIAIASLVERLALAIFGLQEDHRRFQEWRDVLTHIKETTDTFYSSGILHSPSDYLELNDQLRISLKRPVRNSKAQDSEFSKAAKRLEEAVVTTLRAYLEPDRPLSKLLGPLDVSEDSRVEFLQKIAERLQNLCGDGHFTNLVTEVRPDSFANEISERVLSKLVGRHGVFYHPTFPRVRLFEDLIMKSEFFFARDRPGAIRSFDLYAVVREARGWSTHNPARRNLIVRDLLWIRSSAEPIREYNEKANRKDHDGEIVGVYVSAIDRECFFIERIELQGENIILTARTNRVANIAQKMTLIFSDSPYAHPLQTRDGMLSGFAGDNNTLGAWKVLLIRPDWGITGQLKAIFEQANIDTLNTIYNICEDANVIGVSFSEELRDKNSSIQERREAFRSLILADKEFSEQPRNMFGRFFTEKLFRALVKRLGSGLSAAPRDDLPASIANLVISTIGEVVEEDWYLIEPAQIITFRGRPITESEVDIASVRSRIECLLERNDIERFVPGISRQAS